jgi:predicted enzyme related to lactoylglutathione lyase
MEFENVLAHLDVGDFDGALSWYEKFFGRKADRRPMDGTAEWQLSAGGGIQIYGDSGAAATVVLGVEDVDNTLVEINGRGISVAVDETLSGKFRLAFVKDPAGNTIVLSSQPPATKG